jgi:hypothetical protein
MDVQVRSFAMLRAMTTSLLAAAAALAVLSAPALASDKKKAVRGEPESIVAKQDRSSIAYRRGPQVRGFLQRRGGYSYASQDSINTYGDSQSRYSNYSLFRNRDFGRQSSGGPFDSDFFFDSGIAPRGGNSPYLN